MPKIKSNSSAKKRFRFTATGKIKRGSKNRRHLLTCKSTKRKRRLRKDVFVHATQEHQIKAMLPYG